MGTYGKFSSSPTTHNEWGIFQAVKNCSQRVLTDLKKERKNSRDLPEASAY
jgi:hypothetical protein